MRKRIWLGCLSVAAAFSFAPNGLAQRPGEITLFSDRDFRGQTYTLTGPREFIRLNWQVRSARVRSGEIWEVCTGTQYQGQCTRLDQNVPGMRLNVASGRPLSTPVERPTPLPQPVPPGRNESLRGMSAEFFPAPSDGRGRVLSCPGGSGSASCAGQNADRFCRSRGWTASSHERQETISGRNFLADVLCTRTRN